LQYFYEKVKNVRNFVGGRLGGNGRAGRLGKAGRASRTGD